MNKGRLFTFGCSYTKYTYPTWADIIGKSWSYHENWGRPGGGNYFIFNSLMECLQRNEFTKDDCVMILWTGIARVDYYQFGKWRSEVNIFPEKNRQLDLVNCPDGYEITSYALIYAAHEILKHKSIPYESMTWVEYDDQSAAGKIYKTTLEKIKKIDFDINQVDYNPLNSLFFKTRLTDLYHDLAGPDWPSLESIVKKQYQVLDPYINKEITDFIDLYEKDREIELSSKNFIDKHPRPIDHLNTVKKFFPNLVIDADTEQWIQEIDNKLLTGQFFDYSPPEPVHRL